MWWGEDEIYAGWDGKKYEMAVILEEGRLEKGYGSDRKNVRCVHIYFLFFFFYLCVTKGAVSRVGREEEGRCKVVIRKTRKNHAGKREKLKKATESE